MPKKPKLPRGLREYEASLGDTKYTEELAKRLLDLPKHGFHRDLLAVQDALKVVEGAAVALDNAKALAVRIARRMFVSAVDRYTTKQLQKATGYEEK